VGRLALRGARHVRDYGSASEPAVHRVWLSPPRIVSCVDGAWGLVGSSLRWDPVTGRFCARSGPGS
jgi:hypothetical protein